MPGNTRQLFEIDGLKFGISICHEGWRYPETVRWAAVRGAKIVFHPQHTGSDQEGELLTQWGAVGSPYYEKAMMCRGLENTIYFASVNYALRYQESATSLITPSGQCQAHLPYGQEGLLVVAIDLEEATGLLASRYAPERYGIPAGVSNREHAMMTLRLTTVRCPPDARGRERSDARKFPAAPSGPRSCRRRRKPGAASCRRR